MAGKRKEVVETGHQSQNVDPLPSIDILHLLTKNEYPLSQLNQEFASAIIQAGIDASLLPELVIRQSPVEIDGDFGFHCAPLAKIMRQSPNQIAQELAAKLRLDPSGIIIEYVAAGPYVNAKVDFSKFGALVRNSVFEMGADYGKENIGVGQRIVIDMSSPNIAKRMSIGHLRSTIIGDSLARIFKHLQYEVIKDNHLGDWGTQFGHLLRAIELWGDEAIIAANPIEELQKLYVRISDAGEPDSDLYKELSPEEAEIQAKKIKDEGREWFQKLENGDQEAREKWQKIVDWSLLDFQKMYKILGVDFDWVRGESFYENMLSGAIEKVRESGIATESDGALVVNMEEDKLGVAIIQKSDGATLYMTRDIATGIHRSVAENADGMIYVVGEDQKFYFEQLFEILRRMGYPLAEKSKHVYFGMIRLPEGKMSTRKGRVILLEDVIKEALERTAKLVEERTHVTSEEEREQLIQQVAIGALKWNDLMADPRRSIVFDWDTMLTMEGNSAPYVQYAYARTSSLLENIDLDSLSQVDILPEHETEKLLMKSIAAFPQAVQSAGELYNPSKIAAYIYELTKAFNAFYHEVSVLREENPQKKMSRLAITAMTAQTLRTGLNLLGIDAPRRM